MVSISNQSILDNIKLGSVESAIEAVSSASFTEPSSDTACYTISLEDCIAGSSCLDVSKHDSSVGVCSRGNVFLNGTSALLEVVTKGMIVGNISESNVAEEIGSSRFKVPLSENLIHTVEVSLANIKLTG